MQTANDITLRRETEQPDAEIRLRARAHSCVLSKSINETPFSRIYPADFPVVPNQPRRFSVLQKRQMSIDPDRDIDIFPLPLPGQTGNSTRRTPCWICSDWFRLVSTLFQLVLRISNLRSFGLFANIYAECKTEIIWSIVDHVVFVELKL